MEKFNINKKFGFVQKLTKMVLNDDAHSLMVIGTGGMGKSYTIEKTLEKEANKEDYQVIKGYSTPKGLYETLYNYNGQTLIFDDCDAVLKNKTAVNLLKTAVDTDGSRTLTWAKSGGGSSETPDQFKFTGRIIFISNLKRKELADPLISRSYFVDLTMTQEEVINRMEQIVPYIKQEVLERKKKEALNFLSRHKGLTQNLNLRTLLKVINVRKSYEDDEWKELAKYVMSES